MSAKNDGGPAFPQSFTTITLDEAGKKIAQSYADCPGLDQRAYAAIQLRVPESGIDWLDAMIMKSKRDEFAGRALAGMAANTMLVSDSGEFSKGNFRACYFMADAMLAESERGMK